jgi:hypothetical protein
MTRRTTAVAAVSALAVAALLAVVPDAAYAAAAPTPGANLRATAAQDCKLINDLQPVVTDLLTTINGGATTPGSVAWLDARSEKAKEAGRPNLATWLSERATLRKDQGATLGVRQQLLSQGVAWCSAHGYGAGAAS